MDLLNVPFSPKALHYSCSVCTWKVSSIVRVCSFCYLFGGQLDWLWYLHDLRVLGDVPFTDCKTLAVDAAL